MIDFNIDVYATRYLAVTPVQSLLTRVLLSTKTRFPLPELTARVNGPS